MNNYHQIMCKTLVLACCLFAVGLNGQTQKKEYKETFSVGDNTVLDINTSHTDIEFDTWNRKEVVVEASIELEGATKEEAAAYFKENGIKILGNSERIEISTRGDRSWAFKKGMVADLENIVIDIPEIPDLEPLFLDLQIPEIPEIVDMPPMPPLPPMKFENFDYEKYKEDGEKYIQKWAEEFTKNFDEKYEKKWEEWGERFAERMEARTAQMEERKAEREVMLKEREEIIKEKAEIRKQAQEERRQAMEERRQQMQEAREAQKNVIITGDAPRIFYRSSEGENKSFKVKKTIKIKMPKSAKLNMNVRHGEVKLAENTKNMQATLSYSRLLATTIDGDETNILASYSPVNVQRWNYGKLKTQFSEDVALRDVQHLTLVATSSDVTIERLLKSGMLKNNLGALRINAVNQDFNELDISIQNGELVCVLPQGPFQIYVEGISNDLSTPSGLVLERSQKGNQVINKGYHGDSGTNRSIKINARYSDIALKQ